MAQNVNHSLYLGARFIGNFSSFEKIEEYFERNGIPMSDRLSHRVMHVVTTTTEYKPVATVSWQKS